MTTNPYGKKPTQNTTDGDSEPVVESVPQSLQTAKKKKQKKIKFKRKLTNFLLKPVAIVLVNFIWTSCRVKVIGQKNMDEVVKMQKPVIPCYWHQQHLFCAWYMLKQIKRGINIGFLVSPSADGEIPAKIVSSRGAIVIRGSSTRTGAQALRDMYQIIVKQGVSPVTTSDGPTGPIFKFKPGAVMLSQMTKAPMLPIACAAKNAWYINSWDRFMIPKPFTQIVVAVGEQVTVETKSSNKDTLPEQQQMEVAINTLMQQAKLAL
ncbi:MAG: lysophospholipid acyltransferase family protein [Methylococcaceae bacterium]